MNLDFSAEDNAFREEVRTFLAENYPAELRAKQGGEEALSKEDYFSWHRILAKKRLVRSRPGRSNGAAPAGHPTQKYIWSEEQARADTLPILPFGVVDARPRALHIRHAGAEGALPPRHPRRPRMVVPGLFRARRRL